MLAAIAAVAAAGCGLRSEYQIARENREAYVRAHPGLDEATRNAIRVGDLLVGMSFEQVHAAWGPPERVLIFAGGRSVEWIFGCNYPHLCDFDDRRLFRLEPVITPRAWFYDGKLTNWRQ